MSNFKFSHYISRMALNGVSIAVYVNKDESIYRLIAEKDGKRIKGTLICKMSADDYDELPHDPYNSLERFFATASMCGIDFH